MNLRDIIRRAIAHHEVSKMVMDPAAEKPPHRGFRSWLVKHNGPNRAQRRA